jgi:hypothetical protein
VSDPDALSPELTPVELKFSLWGLTFDPHRLIYATIILMTTMAIFDEGTDPFTKGPLLSLVGVVVAPLFALTMAHAFSDALDVQIRNGRRLTWADRRRVVVDNLEYLYVAVPPIALTVFLAFLGWDANDVVGLVQILGTVSLFLWGMFAARQARLRTWTQVRFGFNYAVMGLVVVAVELLITH